MMYQYCTLFDKNYIYRGLAMYESLCKHSPKFTLWILCMDDIVYEQLKSMNLASVKLIRLQDFEGGDEELLNVKPTRTMVEYCWTISPSLPLYILKHNSDFKYITYLDSDLYFFSSPEVIFEEIGSASIAIVRHNYSKELYYLEERSGIYNVSWVTIKNDQYGLACLHWWRERCLEWCYNRFEDGKLGDQIYLNDWLERFTGVHVIKNKGVNLAPWNVNKYHLSYANDKIFIDEDILVFYHFHSFKMFSRNNFLPYYSSYLISNHDRELIYIEYMCHINRLIDTMQKKYPGFIYGFDKKPTIWYRFKLLLKRSCSFWFYYKSLKSL